MNVAAIHACHSSAGTASVAMPATVPARAARGPTSAPAAASAAPRPNTPINTSSGNGAGRAGSVIAIATDLSCPLLTAATARPVPSRIISTSVLGSSNGFAAA